VCDVQRQQKSGYHKIKSMSKTFFWCGRKQNSRSILVQDKKID